MNDLKELTYVMNLLFNLDIELAKLQLVYKIEDFSNKKHIENLKYNEIQLIKFLLDFRSNLKLDAFVLKNNFHYNFEK